MVFLKAFNISNTNIMRTSEDSIDIIMQRKQMKAADAYDKVKSTPSRMDDPYAHVLEYISYWL